MLNVFLKCFFILLTLQFIDGDEKNDEKDGDNDILNFFDDVEEKTEEMEPDDSASQDGNAAASLCLSIAAVSRSFHKTTSFVLDSQMAAKRKAMERGDSANCA